MDPVIVSGCHRSGTSFIMRLLASHGIQVGPYANWQGPDNPEGFWEDRRIVQVNEILLGEAGVDWRDPIPVDRDLASEGYDVNTFSLPEMAERPGFKDPRFAFTWPTWRRTWKDSILIGVLRHPLQVGESLQSRGNIHPNDMASLWERSNKNLCEWGAQWVHFPTGKGLRTVFERIGLPFQESLFERIFNPDLVHFRDEGDGPSLYEDILSTIED